MTDVTQVSQDLNFVRGAVSRKDSDHSGPASIYCLWAIYVLVGYVLIDFAPAVSGWFFFIGGFAGGAISWILGRRWSKRVGECDMELVRRRALHWAGGIVLSVALAIALTIMIPDLRHRAYSGQILVVLIGMVYFLAGVHFDRHFLWLGLVLMTGGLLVGLMPRYGWSALGAIIALGLFVAAALSHRRFPRSADQGN